MVRVKDVISEDFVSKVDSFRVALAKQVAETVSYKSFPTKEYTKRTCFPIRGNGWSFGSTEPNIFIKEEDFEGIFSKWLYFHRYSNTLSRSLDIGRETYIKSDILEALKLFLRYKHEVTPETRVNVDSLVTFVINTSSAKGKAISSDTTDAIVWAVSLIYSNKYKNLDSIMTKATIVTLRTLVCAIYAVLAYRFYPATSGRVQFPLNAPVLMTSAYEATASLVRG